jgi:tripartite-type tricarboxylate transporter receptor subunit TctC
MHNRRTLLVALGAVTLTVPFGAFAQQQPYPVKPIRVIVTTAPGGSDDFQGRLIAQGLTEAFGQQVIVENRPGGGAMIGREFVARAVPDGYTLLLGGSAMGTVPALRPSSKLDVLRDFTPISQISSYPLLLVVHPSVPAKSVKELIALARVSPGKLNFGSSGAGQSPHLAAELFKSMAKVDIVHISYQGSAPAYVDIMSGRVDMIFGVIAAAIQQVRAGKVRPLGVTGTLRATMLPDIPTIAEAALPGYEYPSWMAVFGPSGLPRDAVTRLNVAIQKTMIATDTRKRMLQVGLEPETNTPEQLAEKLKNDVGRLGKIIRDAGIKIE